jgi:NADH-quinone oxidoreductase subunit H
MGDPVTSIANWLIGLMTGWGLSEGLIAFILSFLGVGAIATAVLVVAILLVWVERKVVARFQDRVGPNRLGPFGLIQPLADIIKLLIKEDIIPDGADRTVYNIAPILALASVLLLWAVIPLAPTVVGADLRYGVLYIVAIGALGTLSIIMGGWASRNKYALLGAFRQVAQVVSYEVPMVIALLVPVIFARSMSLVDIAQEQSLWFVLLSPVGAVILLITAIAELGRAPFDLNEAESEIVAGYHIEYTGMKFGLFYAGELLHALTFGAVISTLFLGGWRGPGAEAAPILGIFYIFLKAFFLYWVIMWIKYSLPRIRIDHMLAFNWKFLTPLALALLMVTAVLDKILPRAADGGISLVYALGMLVANLVIGWIALQIVRATARTQRQRVAEPRPFARPPQPVAAPENPAATAQPPVSSTPS